MYGIIVVLVMIIVGSVAFVLAAARRRKHAPAAAVAADQAATAAAVSATRASGDAYLRTLFAWGASNPTKVTYDKMGPDSFAAGLPVACPAGHKSAAAGGCVLPYNEALAACTASVYCTGVLLAGDRDPQPSDLAALQGSAPAEDVKQTKQYTYYRKSVPTNFIPAVQD